MQLYAVFVAGEELDTWSPEDGLRRLGESEAHLTAAFPPTDYLAGMLETVRIQLEGDTAGSRFPLLWGIGLALTDNRIYFWDLALAAQRLWFNNRLKLTAPRLSARIVSGRRSLSVCSTPPGRGDGNVRSASLDAAVTAHPPIGSPSLAIWISKDCGGSS